MKKQNNNTKGFTLVELIVVVAILAVLAATAVFAIGSIRDQAADASLNADANLLIRTLNTYNSLANTQITDISTLSAAELRNLELDTDIGDLVDLALGIDIPEDRWGAVKGAVRHNGSIWVRGEGDKGEGDEEEEEEEEE